MVVGAWHAVGFWGGAPWVRAPHSCRAGLLRILLLGFVRGRVLGGCGVVGGVSGGLVVNCIVDASIKNVFLLLFWFAAPLGPSFVLPVRSLVGGVGVGGGARAPRGTGVGWAGPSAVRAPVSDVRFVVVCCVLFVDF